MKDVVFAFLANTVELLADGRLVVIGPGVDGFVIPHIPVTVPVSFVAKLTFGLEELSQPHTLAIEHTKPDGTREPVGVAVPLALQRDPRDVSGDDAKAVAIAGMAIKFDLVGVYKFHLMVDQEEKLTRTLNVVQIPENVAPVSTGG